MADEIISTEVQSFLDMVESQYSSKPVFMGVLRTYLEAVDAATQIAVKIPERFSLTSSDIYLGDDVNLKYTDAWLDKIGEIVGVTRAYPYNKDISGLPAVMDNYTYKLVLSAKIMQNSWDGTYGKFQKTWDEIFGDNKLGVTVTCEDLQNMHCNIQVQGNLTNAKAALIKSAKLFPKPMGVTFDFTESGRITQVGYAYAVAKGVQNYMRVTAIAED